MGARELGLSVFFACVAGCGARTGLSTGDAPPDGGACGPEGPPPVDLLFVVDDSASMEEEQAFLADRFEGLARALATGDLDGDGAADFPPVADLHVGVVSSDMGWLRLDGARSVPTACAGAALPLGDDGILRAIDGPACGGASGRVLALEATGSVERFAEAFGCLARTGTDGCGFEMPLEAALKAVTPATSPLRFAGRTRGHADGDNEGFLRVGSLVAVVVVTDEDDDSLADASFERVESAEARALGGPWLHPVARYVEGLRALRPDRPERVAFAAIAGVPADLAGPVRDPDDAARILADPRMRRVFDPRERTALVPACTSPHSRAAPARRLVELAGALPGPAVVWPICDADLRGAAAAIATMLGRFVEAEGCR